MFELRPSHERGKADYGWLQARYTFSFAHYMDPKQRGFSDLLVINDDRIHPGKGFGTHGHRDMEIFTYVLQGELAHKDSMGNGSVIRPGDVQMMSAGSGIQHSEFNNSDTADLKLLQIWIVPNRYNVTPRYQQVHFAESEKRGRMRPIITPEGSDGSLSVYQDVRVYAGLFDGAETAELSLPPNRYAYLHLARGRLKINGTAFEAGDGARIRQESHLQFSEGEGAEILLFDLRPNEQPEI
jgi:quercetin 2,3-dioxygenase